MVASDKLFYWLFQQHAERIQPLVDAWLPQMEGYVFSAPVLKERECRLDGLFLPPPDQPELPALILEAQMAADPAFPLRLYAETGRLLQQQDRQGGAIRHWQVVVICLSRELNSATPPLQKALGMLLLPEDQLPACLKAIRAEAAGTELAAEIDDVIVATVVSRFSGRIVPENGLSCWDPGPDRPIHPPRPGLRLSPHPCRSGPVLQPSPHGSATARARPSAAWCFAEDVAPG